MPEVLGETLESSGPDLRDWLVLLHGAHLSQSSLSLKGGQTYSTDAGQQRLIIVGPATCRAAGCSIAFAISSARVGECPLLLLCWKKNAAYRVANRHDRAQLGVCAWSWLSCESVTAAAVARIPAGRRGGRPVHAGFRGR